MTICCQSLPPKSLDFDPATEQVIGDEEANRLVRREYREHWGRPKG